MDLHPMDQPAGGASEPCALQCMNVTVESGEDLARWCIWCGHGSGDYRLMVLRAGAPMPGKITAVNIGTWPLMRKPELNWI